MEHHNQEGPNVTEVFNNRQEADVRQQRFSRAQQDTSVSVAKYLQVSLYTQLLYDKEIDTDIVPEISKNSEHRIRFEERVTTMQTDIGKILTVVEKMSKNE